MSAYVDNPLKDRMKAFLLNEDMADVHFLVGFDDAKVRTARSPPYNVSCFVA